MSGTRTGSVVYPRPLVPAGSDRRFAGCRPQRPAGTITQGAGTGSNDASEVLQTILLTGCFESEVRFS